MVTLLVVMAVGYVLGSIPSGVWLGMIFKKTDIRDFGSKSIGAANTFRVLGAGLGAVVLLLDIAKGLAACYVGSRIDLGDIMLSSNQLAMIAGLAAVAGHLFPLFARFRGGKGVATGAGMLLFIAPLETVFALIVFVCTVALTRYVSLGSILAAAFFCAVTLVEKYYFGYPLGEEMPLLASVILLLMLYTHRSNLRRLLNGTENRFGGRP